MPTGRFCWYDLMTTDPQAGRDFYTQTIGWGTEPWQGSAEYLMWTTPRGPLGGIGELPQEARDAGAPPHWLAYIEVENVADTLAKTARLGGSVMVPATPIDEAGEFGVFSDPQGAALALFTSNSGPTEGHPPQPLDFFWHELMTNDYKTALEFYSELFGWEGTKLHEMGPGADYQIYGQPANPIPLGGMFNLTEEMKAKPAWIYYITVESLGETLGKVREHGGQVLVEPMEVPGGNRIAQCTDPQGAFFALHEPAPADA